MRDKRARARLDPILLRRSLAWRTRVMTARWRRLPDFVIIGAQRGGTTSLFGYLTSHPAIQPAFRKEVHFYDLHFSRGTRWYRAHFPAGQPGGRITGEATPNYLFHPDAPSRLKATNPDAKLVAVLRNPIDRAHSAWRLKTAEGHETLSFEAAVAREIDAPMPALGDYHDDRRRIGDAMRLLYLAKSRYDEQLERWLAILPSRQFCVITTEELFAHPARTLSVVTEALGLEPLADHALPALNRTRAETMDSALRGQLSEYFRPHNLRLEDMLGRRFDWD